MLQALTDGLALVRPYLELAKRLPGRSADVMQRIGKLSAAGIISRLGLSSGTAASAGRRTPWWSGTARSRRRVGGEALARLPGVSLCYQRRSNLTSGRTGSTSWCMRAARAEARVIADAAAASRAVQSLHKVLFSTHCYKQTGANLRDRGDCRMRQAPLAPGALDSTDRSLINSLQDGLPLSHHPFAKLGRRSGNWEAEVIARVKHLRDIGAITRFGPFFDAEAMGGNFCLCAMEVPADRFEQVMTLVNAHPEVAHNYERDHRLNMWFVVASETPQGTKAVIRKIEKETGLAVLPFPKLKEFFVGFRVDA